MALTAASDTEVLSQLFEGGAETLSRRESPEAEHRVVALLHGSMALRGVVVQILRRPVQDLPTDDPMNRPAVRRVQVRRDALRPTLRDLEQAP